MLEQYNNKPIIFEFDKEINRKMSSQRDASEKSFDTDDDFALIKHIKMEPETMLTQGDDIMAQLQHDSSDLEVEPSFSMEGLNGDDCNEGLMMQHMDIREPLSTLRNLLEQRLGIELTDYSFWLHTQMLESHKNLVDQCVQGEGLVQVNLHIKAAQRMINIVDVLKPAEDYVEVAGNNSPEPVQEVNTKQKVMRWVVDTHYKQEQLRLKIPEDPVNWTVTHVKHWLQWAVRHFNLAAIKLADWNITGAELCALTMDEFHEKVPLDPNDVFWTHLELLKTCKFVAVEQKNSPEDLSPEKNAKIRNEKPPKPRTAMNQNPRLISMPMGNPESSSQITLTPSTRSANSGQIQLWQFLLELLTDRDHRDAIQWVGTEGEFRLNQHETVARLWGQRKNKPSMNYEKLSRALRYYYDGDMISKVHGKRFVYKFVCDLKNVLGYSAAELSRLVAGGKKFGDSDPMTSPFI